MKKKLLSILLALALVCSSVPAPVFAADGDTTTSTSSQSTGETTPATNEREGLLYLDANGKEQTIPDGVTLVTSDTTALDGNISAYYLVSGDLTVSERITVTGSVTLILADGAHLEAEQGIGVSAGNSLTITAQSTDEDTMGSLTANGKEYCAAIGGTSSSSLGEPGSSAGKITINGGDIEATGGAISNGFGGAGIGGGFLGSCGEITINGGVVTATGESLSAGIGSGRYAKTGGSIVINGGTVTATGGAGGAGIGGSFLGSCGEITIHGGIVTAIGGAGDGMMGTGAGIGNGSGGKGAVFSTGTDGHAVLYADSITGSDGDTSGWDCIWFQGTKGTVYGDVTLSGDLTIEEGETLTVPAGATLNDGGKTITNNGTIRVKTGGSYAGEETSPNKISYEGVTYLDEQGNTQTTTEKVTLLNNSTQNWTLTSGWYLVTGDVTVSDRITVSGEVTLILADRAKLTAGKGIEVSENNSLTITAQSKGEDMGSLSVDCPYDPNVHADALIGIGGEGGSITIWGGNIRSEAYTTGIGGENSTVVIRDGVVSAVSTRTDHGQNQNQGIGGNGGRVIISGGRVTTKGSNYNGSDIGGNGLTLSTDKPDGSNGDALLGAGIFQMQTGLDSLDCILLSSVDRSARVVGSVTLKEELTVGEGETLTIPAEASLTVPEGVTLKNNGTIKVAAGGRYVGAETSPNKVEYEQVRYLDENGEEKLTTGPVGLVTNSTTELESGWYLVKDRITIPQRLTVSGEVTIILANWYELNARGGIEVSEGNSLTITAQSADAERMGSLTATGKEYCAAIGGTSSSALGEPGSSAGKITINGGNIEATGGAISNGFGGAGIGGGFLGSCGEITINGGVVTATGESLSAGIGSGRYAKTGGSIVINGGIVTATGGAGGAGIGGSFLGNCGEITIHGGIVTAIGGAGDGMTGTGAGIGNGSGGKGAVFSTGTDGNAVLYADSITGSDGDTSGWDCIWFADTEGRVYGNVTLSGDLTVKAGETLTIPAEASLTVPEGVTLKNNGTIKVAAGGSYAGEETSPNKISYEGVTYLDEQGNTRTTTEKVTLLDDSTQNWTLTTGWYLVRGSFTVSDRITISGDVTLILADGAHLEAEQGIGVSAGNSLTITAQSKGEDMGSLSVDCPYDPNLPADALIGIGGEGGSITIWGAISAARPIPPASAAKTAPSSSAAGWSAPSRPAPTAPATTASAARTARSPSRAAGSPPTAAGSTASISPAAFFPPTSRTAATATR